MGVKRTPLGDLERELQDPEFAKLYGAADAKSEFALVLAQARGQRGLTRVQLARKMGWQWSTSISEMERGDGNRSLGGCGSLLAVMGYRLKMSLAPLVSDDAGENEGVNE